MFVGMIVCSPSAFYAFAMSLRCVYAEKEINMTVHKSWSTAAYQSSKQVSTYNISDFFMKFECPNDHTEGF